MVNFTDVSSRQSFRLKETPTWRKVPGEGLTQTYAKMREASYRRNAGVVRDRRFQQSIGRDPDYALKVKMNKMLSDSQFLAGRTGDVDLMRGMYSKLTPKYSRSAGSLTSFQQPGSTGTIQGSLPSIAQAPTADYQPAVSTLLGTYDERERTQRKVIEEQERDRQRRRGEAMARIQARRDAEGVSRREAIDPRSVSDGALRNRSLTVYKGSSKAPKHHTPIVTTGTKVSHMGPPAGTATATAAPVGKHSAPGGSVSTPPPPQGKGTAVDRLDPQQRKAYKKRMAALKQRQGKKQGTANLSASERKLRSQLKAAAAAAGAGGDGVLFSPQGKTGKWKTKKKVVTKGGYASPAKAYQASKVVSGGKNKK
jgi:hypothetical protein